MLDLFVLKKSGALSGQKVDLVVSGSIAAVQSPLFIRALRRVGARITPWITEGARQFITPMSLSWAAAQKTRDSFSGENTHLATKNALIIAPASANFIGSLSSGSATSPMLTMAMSYLGQKKPVLLLPSMHESLAVSPFFQKNLKKLLPYLHILKPRLEEEKQKFPSPNLLADECAHLLNVFQSAKQKNIVITLGGTISSLDSVRYLGNYATGRLGSLVAEELYRYGLSTYIVAGTHTHLPQVATKIIHAREYQDMFESTTNLLIQNQASLIHLAAILDFTFERTSFGKISSKTDSLTFRLFPTPKMLTKFKPFGKIKVAAKLLFKTNESDFKSIAEEYLDKYQLSGIVINNIDSIHEDEHLAHFFEENNQHSQINIPQVASSKQELATILCKHTLSRLGASYRV